MTWLSEINKARWAVDLVFNPWVALVVWVFGAAVYFLPPETFGAQGEPRQTIDAHRGWIALGSLAAFIGWASLCMAIALKSVRRKLLKRRRLGAVMEHLPTLSPEEQSVLAYCLVNNRRTVQMDVTGPVSMSLVNKGFLVMASGTGDAQDWPCTVPSDVWNELQAIKDGLLPPGLLEQPEAQGDLEDFVRSTRGKFG